MPNWQEAQGIAFQPWSNRLQVCFSIHVDEYSQIEQCGRCRVWTSVVFIVRIHVCKAEQNAQLHSMVFSQNMHNSDSEHTKPYCAVILISYHLTYSKFLTRMSPMPVCVGQIFYKLIPTKRAEFVTRLPAMLSAQSFSLNVPTLKETVLKTWQEASLPRSHH